MDTSITSRKEEHVNLALRADVHVKGVTNGFENFDVVPTSVPDLDFDEISLEVDFLGKTFSAPVLVAGMTGGYPKAEEINKSLARICSELNIPMGVGSQRAMIVNPEMTRTFNVKSEVEDVFLIGNIGLVQFSKGFSMDDFNTAVEKISADAMAVHVNSFQELCQPEGDLDWRGSWTHLENICKRSPVPIIGKEVGSGIAGEEAARMETVGCSAIDVGGAGGTSWPKLELMRNDNPDALPIDDPTLEWGINTALATWESTNASGLPVIATGGMYHGLMAAKAILMGATMVGIARPVLQALINGGEKMAKKYLENYILNIKRVMFLTGFKDMDAFRHNKDLLIPKNDAFFWLHRRKLI